MWLQAGGDYPTHEIRNMLVQYVKWVLHDVTVDDNSVSVLVSHYKYELVEITFVVHARLHAGQADLPMPDGSVTFSFLQNAETGSGVHPGPYFMGSGFNFGSKASGDVKFPLSPPSSVEAKLLGPYA
jgi:hypothetical protein